MQKEQMKALLSVLVSTATFFSARCESAKSQRPAAPDNTIAISPRTSAPASSTRASHAEVPAKLHAPAGATLAPLPADIIVLGPTSRAPRFFYHQPLHVGALSDDAALSPLGL
jgi:hypothetical protein